MRLLLLKSWRDLRARRWQAVGLALLVAVVVAAIAGANRATRMMESTRDDTYRELALADLEIRCSPTLPGVLERVGDVEGIAAAEEQMLLEGLLHSEARLTLPALVRVLPDQPPQINRLRLLDGRYPREGEAGVILDRSLRQETSLEVGDTVELEIGGRRRSLPVLGISLSPDHLLYPAHPEYMVPLQGTVAVLGVSASAAEEFERTDLVDSLLFRFAPGADPTALQTRLLEDLGISPLAVIPREEAPTARAVEMIIRFFYVYVPAGLLVLVTVALTLLALTLQRMVHSQASQIGVLAALGHRPAALAGSYLTAPILACIAGALLGGACHGMYARFVFASYAASSGFAPLRDPGPGPALVVASLGCIALASAMTFGMAFFTAARAPLRNLRPSVRHAGGSPLIGRLAVFLRRLVSLPLSVVLGATYISRRPWASAATILCLGLNFSLVVSFVFVHVTHETSSVRGMEQIGLEATVYFAEPVGDEALPRIAEAVEGEVQPMISAQLVVQYPDALAIQRVLGLEPRSWIGDVRIVRGHRLEDPTAAHLVVDQFLADARGVDVGDRLTLYPSYSAPEGTEFEIVGVLGGSSLGYAAMPLETGRRMLGLPGLSTSVCVGSALPTDELEARLRKLPGVENVQALDRARSGAGDAFAGLERVLALAVMMSILVAVLFLGLLAALDSTDRAPDLAVLRAIGWRDRSMLVICVTEVATRGALAFLLSIPAAPLMTRWLIAHLEEANGYRMDLETPAWAFVAVGVVCALLIPLGALPAWRAARRASAGAALRLLTTE